MERCLISYFREVGIEHLYGLFVSLGIDEPKLLARLKYSDLERLGIENFLERKKVFEIINKINEELGTDEIKFAKLKEADTVAQSCLSNTDKLIYETGTEEAENFAAEVVDEPRSYRSVGESQLLISDPSESIFIDKLNYEFKEREQTALATLAEKGETLAIKDKSSLIEDHDKLKSIKITVCVRKRLSALGNDIVEVHKNKIIVNEPKTKIDLEPYVEKHKFVFDFSFDEKFNNEEVYRAGIRNIANSVINGDSGSIIAYGQTGTGKTYTMLENNTGVIFLAMKDIMKLEKKGTILFCEIYMGQVYDLLNNGAKINLREVKGRVHLSNSKEVEFGSYNEFCSILKTGLALRKTGVTGANIKSSRSHAIILINFPNRNTLTFVDLAGSERGMDRLGAISEIKNEGAEINKSLLALKECIRGMERDQKHLPFRQSKLTQILKNSFVGESKICLVATISPMYENVEHTLNTLRYAARIKESLKSSKDSNSSLTADSSSVLNFNSSIISINEFKEQSSSNTSSKAQEIKLIESLRSKIKAILLKIHLKVDKIQNKEEITKLYNECCCLERSIDKRR